MPFGIGTGIGIDISIVDVSRRAPRAGRFADVESMFMPGMPLMVPGLVGGLGGVCDDALGDGAARTSVATTNDRQITAEFRETADATGMIEATHSAMCREARSVQHALWASCSIRR